VTPPRWPAGTRRQRDVVLSPGEYFVGDDTHHVRTLLGSCVSVTLWCRTLRIGAMSHSLLAQRGEGPSSRVPRDQMDARYGDEALHLMLHELLMRGVKAPSLQAKIFGGGDMFRHLREGAPVTVGRRNGEAARSLLQAHGIEVVSESLFGEGHRQIAFDIATGHVWSRQVKLPPGDPQGPATESPSRRRAALLREGIDGAL
jgi:chemotaxis protein CheD